MRAASCGQKSLATASKSICAGKFQFRAAINRSVRPFPGSCGQNSIRAGNWPFRASLFPFRAGENRFPQPRNPSVRAISLFVRTISDLNYYIREKYKTFDTGALEQLYDELLCLTVPYGEGKVGKGIFWRPEPWSYDCLLALESYDKFFEVTKPAKIFSTNTHFANQKCNVRYFLGMPANAVEFLQIYGGLRNSITNFTKQYPKEYQRILETLFAEEEKKSGSWFERILAESDRKDYQNNLFQCLHFARRSKIPNFCFYAASENLTKQICDVFREAENRLRQKFGEKNVGEKWDDETKLFYEIKDAFPDTEVIHHGKPE